MPNIFISDTMIYIFILVIPLLSYAALAILLLFHLKKYNIDQGSTKKISAIFIAGLIALGILTSIAFFVIPWDSINTSDILGNFLNPSSPLNLNY